jgi:hypothetical protein
MLPLLIRDCLYFELWRFPLPLVIFHSLLALRLLVQPIFLFACFIYCYFAFLRLFICFYFVEKLNINSRFFLFAFCQCILMLCYVLVLFLDKLRLSLHQQRHLWLLGPHDHLSFSAVLQVVQELFIDT